MIRLGVAFSLAMASAAFAGEPADDVTPTTRPINFDLPADSPLEFRGGLIIRPPFKSFGGLSGLALTTPRHAVMVSDKGAWVEFGVEIEAGRLIGVVDALTRPILNAEGAAVEEGAVDAEGLAFDPTTGDLWVSFERDHRLWRFENSKAGPVETIRHPEWERFSENGGIEALARDGQGRLWAIREVSGDYARPFPVFVWDDGVFTEKRVSRPSKHQITGADFGPDGWLYITERRFSFTSGFDIRLRRLKYGEGPDPVAEEVLLDLPSASNIDNIEAIEVWKEDDETLILIASDDNMFLLQRNILALFAVAPPQQ